VRSEAWPRWFSTLSTTRCAFCENQSAVLHIHLQKLYLCKGAAGINFDMRCKPVYRSLLKVHKNENFFGSDFEFCTISLLVMLKIQGFVKKIF
jgi:hypothetical protein